MGSRRRRRDTADEHSNLQDGYRERAYGPYCHHDVYTAASHRVPRDPSQDAVISRRPVTRRREAR